MIADWPQPAATALAGAAAVAAVALTAVRDRHPLALIERLSVIATAVRSDTVRTLLEDERDQRAIRWVLERRAPRERKLRNVAAVLFGVGVVALLVWVLGTIVDRGSAWSWISYLVGLVIVFVSRMVIGIRTKRRSGWMEQERRWRQLPKQMEATRVEDV